MFKTVIRDLILYLYSPLYFPFNCIKPKIRKNVMALQANITSIKIATIHLRFFFLLHLGLHNIEKKTYINEKAAEGQNQTLALLDADLMSLR